MIIFSHGMTKSASTFAYQIASGLIKKHCYSLGLQNYSLFDFIESEHKNFLNDSVDIDAILDSILSNENYSDDNFLVIKLHRSCTPYMALLMESGKAAAFSTYRDPRDVSLSILDAALMDKQKGLHRFDKYLTLSDTLSVVDYQIRCLKSWVVSSKTLFLSFIDLATNPYLAGANISRHLGINYDASVVDDLVKDKSKIWEYNKGKVNRWVEEFRDMDSDWQRRIDDFYFFVNNLT